MFQKFLGKKGMTVEQYKAMEAEKQADVQNEYLGSLEEMLADKVTMDAVKAELKELVSKSDYDKLDKDIQKISEDLAKLTEKRGENKKSLKAAIQDLIEKNKSLPDAQKQMVLQLKADNLFNIQAISGGTYNADEVNIDATLLTETAIEQGFMGELRRELTLLNEIRNAQNLRIGDGLKWIEPADENGAPLKVTEANVKPKGTVKYVRRTKESTKIAIVFYVTEEFLNRADILMPLINQHFRSLVTEVLEEVVMGATDGILSYASTYVVPAGYTVEDANKLDAIAAVAAYQKSLKYKPSHVVLNGLDVAMMFGTKGLDGHYSLKNGGSLQMIDGSANLVVGNTRLRIIEVNDDLLDMGDFVVIDWSKLVFGIGGVITKSDPYTLMESNILKFLMEAPFAVARPTHYPKAVIQATYAEVIEDITPVAEGE